MAELGVLQVWTVVEMAQLLFKAVRNIRDAKGVLEGIAERASRIEGYLRNIARVLEKMELSLKHRMPANEYDQLRDSVVSSYLSCQRTLNAQFSLQDKEDKLRSEASITERIKVATKARRIHRDQAQLDSIISSLSLALSLTNSFIVLQQLDSHENEGATQEYRNKLAELNGKIERNNEEALNFETGIRSNEPDDEECEASCNVAARPRDNICYREHENGLPLTDCKPRPRQSMETLVPVDSLDPRNDTSTDLELRVQKPSHVETSSQHFQASKGSGASLTTGHFDSKRAATDADTVDDQGCTALHHAVYAADVELVHALLENGTDCECKTNSQETPLLIAVYNNHREIVQDLLDHGANPNTKFGDDERTLLHVAVRKEMIATTECLLKYEPSLRDAIDVKGKSPLHYCAAGDGIPQALQQAKLLLDYGADVGLSAGNDQEGNPRTSLYFAVSNSWTPDSNDMVELLVSFSEKAGIKIDTDCLPNGWEDYDCLSGSTSK